MYYLFKGLIGCAYDSPNNHNPIITIVTIVILNLIDYYTNQCDY